MNSQKFLRLVYAVLLAASKTNSMIYSSGVNNVGAESIIIQSQCNCRQVVLDIDITALSADVSSSGQVFNCHCASCRKYHTSAYTSYLRVSSHQLSIRRGKDLIGKYMKDTPRSDESEHSYLERWYCTNCSSKLVSVDMSNDEQSYFVNLGPLNEDTVPTSYSSRWKEQLKQKESNLHVEDTSSWTRALPNYVPSATATSPIWTGSCSCGSCAYEIAITRAAQLQHCYCHLCRELSGGPFATWIPIYKRDFTWTQPNHETERTNHNVLGFVRTTQDGRRHVCRRCRSVLTIVYDSQPDLIWPCAGGLNDESLPSDRGEMERFLKRVCHICCRHQPTWMELPDDGMERLPDAC